MVISGEEIHSVTHTLGDWGFDVSVILSPEGSEKLRAYTSSSIGRQIAIIHDGQIIAAPWVRDAVGGSLAFGNLGREHAQALANDIAVSAGVRLEALGVLRTSASNVGFLVWSSLPYALLGCLSFFAFRRYRWIAAGAVAGTSSVLYRLSQGLYWRLTLPPEPQNEDIADAILDLAAIFADSAEPGIMGYAPPWAEVLQVAAIEVAFSALPGGLIGACVAWALLRSDSMRAHVDSVVRRVMQVRRNID